MHYKVKKWPTRWSTVGRLSVDCPPTVSRQLTDVSVGLDSLHLLESFTNHWLYKTLGVSWHWYRYEFQARGSIHCHGTAKLKNDPGLCKLTETALKGFLAEKNLQQNLCDQNQDILQGIENGKKAAATICDYVDSIMST